MKINEFIKGYQELSDATLKDKYVEGLIVYQYVPYETKIKYAQKCVKEHFADNGLVITNTPMAYLKYTMAVLDLFTTLEVNYTVEEYDDLQEDGLIDIILKKLEKTQIYMEIQIIYEMCVTDFRTITLSPRGFIRHQLQRFAETCNESLKALVHEFEGVDLKELVKMLKK